MGHDAAHRIVSALVDSPAIAVLASAGAEVRPHLEGSLVRLAKIVDELGLDDTAALCEACAWSIQSAFAAWHAACAAKSGDVAHAKLSRDATERASLCLERCRVLQRAALDARAQRAREARWAAPPAPPAAPPTPAGSAHGEAPGATVAAPRDEPPDVVTCPSCGKSITITAEVEREGRCPSCGWHDGDELPQHERAPEPVPEPEPDEPPVRSPMIRLGPEPPPHVPEGCWYHAPSGTWQSADGRIFPHAPPVLDVSPEQHARLEARGRRLVARHAAALRGERMREDDKDD